MKLQDELHHLTALIERETAPRVLGVINQFIRDIRRRQVTQRSLTVGDTIANFALPDQYGRLTNLYDYLNTGPVVLNFYRGGWCPYCNLELKALHHAWPELEYYGARLLTLTPESPDNIAQTVRKNALDFPVLHDANSEVARQFGVAITLSEYMKAFYQSLGLNLSLHNADVLVRLPLPALYVINTDYRIRYAFVNEDYRQRAELDEVVSELRNIQHLPVRSYG